MKKFWNTGKLYKKLLFSYVCMVLVLVLLSPLIQSNIKKYITEKEIQYAVTNLYYIKDLMDTQINAIAKMSYTILADEVVKNAEYELYSNRKIIDRLNSMMGSINWINNCFVVNLESHFIISAEGSEEIDYFQRFQNADGEKIDIRELFESNAVFDCVPCVSDKQENVLLFIAKNAVVKSNNMIVTLVRETELKRFYSGQYNENLGEYMVVGLDGLIYSSSDPDRVLSKLSDDEMTILNDDSSAELDLEKWTPFSKSGYFDWFYIMNINERGINATANKIRFVWIIYIIICVMIELILIFFVSKWVYVPLKRLREKFDIKGTDELGGIENMLDELKVDNTNYMRIYDSLYQVGRGIDINKSFLTGQGELGVIIIRGQKLGLYSHELLKLMLKIDNCSVDFIQMDEHEIIGVVKSLDNIEKIKEAMNSVAHRFLEMYSLSVLIGVGEFVSSEDKLKHSLDSAYYAIDYGNYNGNDLALLSNDVENKQYSIFIEKENIERKLVYAVEQNDAEEIEAVITNIFDANKEIPNIYKYSLSMMLVNIYFTVGNKTGSWTLDYGMLADELKYEYDFKLLRNFFIHLFTGFILEKNEQNKDIVIKNKIMQCIQENGLNQDFTLEVLAEKMGYSPAYMTKLLKKYFNENFTQYLISYRIEKAKELLRQTDKSIESVSKEAGFGTYNNFARIFRKKTGVSPSVYKKNQ